MNIHAIFSKSRHISWVFYFPNLKIEFIFYHVWDMANFSHNFLGCPVGVFKFWKLEKASFIANKRFKNEKKTIFGNFIIFSKNLRKLSFFLFWSWNGKSIQFRLRKYNFFSFTMFLWFLKAIFRISAPTKKCRMY